MNLDNKFCHKCGINIEELKRTCAVCGNPYVFGQRYCSKCKNSLIDESMGLIFNEIGIVYFNLKHSASLIRAEELFKEAKYIEAFKELLKENKLVQIFILNKRDLNWILECLEHAVLENNSYISQVISLIDQLLSDDGSNALKVSLYKNLLEQAKDREDTISEHRYCRLLYRLTKKHEYKEQMETLHIKKQGKQRKAFLFAVFKLVTIGFVSSVIADFLFIALFGYKFPLKYPATNLTEVNELHVWRFIPLFSFIGLSISISYWFAFHKFIPGKKKKGFVSSLALGVLFFFAAGVFWGEIVNKSDTASIIIFAITLLFYGYIQTWGMKDFFPVTWMKIIWLISTPVIFYAAVIPGRIAVPLYDQSAQAFFVGIGFFAFAFILMQSLVLTVFHKKSHPTKLKANTKV